MYSQFLKLTDLDLEILAYIYDRGGKAYAYQIYRDLDRSPGSVYRSLLKLWGLKFVERVETENKVYWVLTEQAKQLLEELLK